MKTIALVMLFSFIVQASQRIDVDTLIKSLYPDTTKIEKRSDIITKKELALIQKKAKTRLRSKLIRYYLFHHGGTTDVAVVSSQKVRTKKAAILYFIHDGKISHIEILAFGEPPEFVPSDKWLEQFNDKTTNSKLTVGEDIAAKSGATLSAKSVTNGARTVLAIYEVKLKKQ